ncbi:MAG: hypothetical protein PHE26_00850 [Syntrophomonadaceae bacterium]|nr:hypothetical protein [Syntrophomonadaceae bacterium]
MTAMKYETAVKRETTLNKEDIWGENVYEEVWLPFGDERENDIQSLLQQGRIVKY